MNRKIMLFSTFFLAIVVSPATPIAQNISPEMAKLIDARDDQRCQKLGAIPGTETYITCRLKLQEMAQAKWAAQNIQLQQQLQNAQATQNQPVMLPPPIQPYILPPPTHYQLPSSTNCISQVIGNQIQTNCQQQ